MFHSSKSLSLSVAWLLLLVSSPYCAAQDLDILAQSVDGRLVTGTVNIDDDPSAPVGSLNVRVHSRFFDSLFVLEEPGFNSLGSNTSTLPPGASALPGGAALAWDFLPMKIGGLASNLLYWNGVGAPGAEPSFGAAPGSEYSLSLFDKNSARFAADGSDRLIPGGTIETTMADGFLHKHLAFFLDNDHDDQNSTVAAEGVYLIAMRLRMAGLDRSAPFYLLWGTPGVSDAVIQSAESWVESRVDTLAPDFAADFDGDLDVDGDDFLTWQRGAGTLSGALQILGDANHDQAVTAADLNVMRSQFGSSLATFPGVTWTWETGSAVPEPAGVLLAAIGLAGVALRRRRP